MSLQASIAIAAAALEGIVALVALAVVGAAVFERLPVAAAVKAGIKRNNM
jgi:hypothetical protein